MTARSVSLPAHVQGAPTLLIRFAGWDAANRRLAGMSAAGRWVARAREAGIETVAIEVPGGGRWPLATRADFRRAGVRGGVPVLAPGAGPAGAAAVDGRFLPTAAALARGGAQGAGEVIDLERPGAAVRRILLATAKPSDGIISRWINRPVSQRISAALFFLVPGVRPWHMTLVVAAVATAMLVALFGHHGMAGLVWGGVLFQVASLLDGVDGEIARASYRSSAAGAVLDTRVDMVTNIGYFVGIAVTLTRLYGGRQALVGGLAVLLALTGLLIVAWLSRRLGGGGGMNVLKPYYRERFPGGWQWLVTETLVAMTSRDFFAFAFGVVIVCGKGWAVSWLLLGFVATWLVAVLCAVPGVLRTHTPAAPLRGI